MPPLSPALIDHGLALALGGRCPLCAELSRDTGALARTPCTECGGVFADEETASRLVEAYRTRSRERLAIHLIVLAATGFVLGFVPLLGAVCLAVGFALFQHRVVSPALALLSRRRRVVSRWTMRLFVATLGVMASVFVTLISFFWAGGVATAIAAPLTLGISWLFSRAYLLRQLARELEGKPVAAWEVGLLVASLVALLGAVVAVVGMIVGSVTLIQMAIEKVKDFF